MSGASAKWSARGGGGADEVVVVGRVGAEMGE